jgi:predicted naringenin-chalcone synthase
MAVNLRSLEVALPDTVLVQDEVRDLYAAQPQLSRLAARMASAAFNGSGIDRRYTVLQEMDGLESAEAPLFFDASTGLVLSPSTGLRNRVYAQEATGLFVRAAARALAACEGVEAADVTHVITVSCTGFFAPGPDYKIVRALGLRSDVARSHLGFMGCFAAFPALRQAKHICEAEPDAVVLVVSAELCTLHVRIADDLDTILGASLFGDGAAAAVVTGRDDGSTRPVLRLDRFATALTPVGEEAMAWNIGDNGFEMVLGTYVPHIIDEHIIGALAPVVGRRPVAAGPTGRSHPALGHPPRRPQHPGQGREQAPAEP